MHRGFDHPVHPLKDQEQLELANLMTRRRQLQGMIVMEENRRRTCTPKVRGNIDLSLAHLRQLLKDLDREIQDSIRRTPLWHENCGNPPELHRRRPQGERLPDRRLCRNWARIPGTKASALAGLAPMNQDSGKHRGKRMIKGWPPRSAPGPVYGRPGGLAS